LSIDTKATIKIGPFSRGGYSRHGVQAADHDFESEATLKLFGIHLPQRDETYLYFTKNNVTADFMVDAVEDLITGQKTAVVVRSSSSGSLNLPKANPLTSAWPIIPPITANTTRLSAFGASWRTIGAGNSSTVLTRSLD
jgi:hypothetical protein